MKEKLFLAAMYLRLSRDDNDINAVIDSNNIADRDGKASKAGFIKTESNSIGSQRELIRTFIREQSDIELYDIYVDV